MSKIRKAAQLYDVAAAFRYQIVAGLDDKKSWKILCITKGFQIKKPCFLNTIDTLIEKLENNSSHSVLIIEQLQKSAFDNTNGSKEEIIEALKELKEILLYNLTEGLDSIYGALTMGSRKDALLAYIENVQKLINEGQTQILKPFSEILGVKKLRKMCLEH